MNSKLQRENPCFGCKERSSICHSICKRYKEWNEKVVKERELVFSRKQDKMKTYTLTHSNKRNEM